MIRTWWCLNMPWHKMRVKEKAVEPFTGKLVGCSCGREYLMHDNTKSFFPYNSAFSEYFKSKRDVT